MIIIIPVASGMRFNFENEKISTCVQNLTKSTNGNFFPRCVTRSSGVTFIDDVKNEIEISFFLFYFVLGYEDPVPIKAQLLSDL